MTSKADILLDKILLWWGKTSLRFPWFVLLIFFALSAISLHYTLDHLGVNTDTSEMLASDLPFQKVRRRLKETFPQDSDTVLLLIDASTPEQAKNAVLDLGHRLMAEKNYVQSLYIPEEGEFFDSNGLLYLELDDLEDLATELSRAQPFIGRLTKDYSLGGLLSILGHAIEHQDDSLPLEIEPLLLKVGDAIKASLEDSYYRLSWQWLMYGSDRVTTRKLILLRPMMDFSKIMPAEQSLEMIRSIIRQMESTYPELKIRVTGEIALEHEELESVSRGAAWAGLFSLILVCLSLFVGLRSIKLMLATLASLLVGLILTAGFATAAVGHLNLISIAFAVLYIGLGVDYAIHFCLRYRDFVQQQVPNRQALIDSIRSVGPSIILCAISTAIGLYAFIPTDYAGVSELGIIAGTGMFIGLAVTLSVLPAILTIIPVKAAKSQWGFFPNWVYCIPFAYAPWIKGLSILSILAASAILFRVEFDSNPVNLRDPTTQSVSTFKELLRSGDESPFALTMLAPDRESAVTAARRFERLPSVKAAVMVLDFVPEDQEAKLAIIENLDLMLGPQLEAFDKAPGGAENRGALASFLAKINHRIETGGSSVSEVLLNLQDQVDRLLRMLDAKPEQASKLLSRLETSLLGSLPTSMKSIQTGLQANHFGLEDLPKQLYQRWVSRNGIYRVQIIPKNDLNDPTNLKEFVEQAQGLEPSITGLPVADQASGKAVVVAFQQAFIGALVTIVLLLLIILRSVKDALLVLFPLILVGAITGAATVLLNSPFNFANIIALPLLLGLGVDSCIHIVHRVRTSRDQENPLKTSTARGIFFSSLTTLFSFSSLAFTAHLGTASMGLLLAVGISLTLFCTLLVLPAFIQDKSQYSVVG